MKIEEYKTHLQKAVINPEKTAEIITNLLPELEKDLTEKESLVTLNSEQETKIRELQDSNVKLFLAATGGKPDGENTDPEDKTPAELQDEFVKELLKEEE